MNSHLIRVLTVFTLFASLANSAISGTIPLFGGTLEASLKLYDYYSELAVKGSGNQESFFLRKEYALGTDFIAGVPGTNNPGSMTAYSASSGAPRSAVWTPYSSPLDDACTPATTDGGLFNISVAIRGTCTFSIKWSNMESKGLAGGILVNNVPGLIGGMGGISDSVSIPFFLVTQDVWSELFLGSNLMDEFGNKFRERAYFPILTMDVAWSPRSTVPEPASLALLCLGLAGLASSRQRIR